MISKIACNVKSHDFFISYFFQLYPFPIILTEKYEQILNNFR